MLQLIPSPWYPDLHVQLNEPSVLLQTASELQLWVSLVHSSISENKHKLDFVSSGKIIRAFFVLFLF